MLRVDGAPAWSLVIAGCCAITEPADLCAVCGYGGRQHFMTVKYAGEDGDLGGASEFASAAGLQGWQSRRRHAACTKVPRRTCRLPSLTGRHALLAFLSWTRMLAFAMISANPRCRPCNATDENPVNPIQVQQYCSFVGLRSACLPTLPACLAARCCQQLSHPRLEPGDLDAATPAQSAAWPCCNGCVSLAAPAAVDIR